MKNSFKQRRNYDKNITWIYQNQWTFIRDRYINIRKYEFLYTPTASTDAGRIEPVFKDSYAFVCLYALERG